jgi:colicin import membrane protein
MPSYWERQAEQRRRRSLSAQAARYSGQAAQFEDVSRRVGEATGVETNSVLEAQRRRREEEERVRVERARREQALARAAEARRAREVEAAAEAARSREEDEAARARLRGQYGERDLFSGSGSAGVRVVTPEEVARNRQVAGEIVFGPDRESVIAGEASRLERFIRDWGLSEQEFRTAGERAGEGRLGAAAGWAGLGLAGAIPFVGQAGRGLVKGVTGVGRAAECCCGCCEGSRKFARRKTV